MTAALRNRVLAALPYCKTLQEADDSLAEIPALAADHCQAMRYGLFEGWEGWRPESIDKKWPDAMVKDYREGREIGRELSTRELPR